MSYFAIGLLLSLLTLTSIIVYDVYAQFENKLQLIQQN